MKDGYREFKRALLSSSNLADKLMFMLLKPPTNESYMHCLRLSFHDCNVDSEEMLTMCLCHFSHDKCRFKNMNFDEYRVRLGSHLQDIRKSRGLTQEQVAEQLGMDRVSIGYIEQGKRSPKLSTLYALARCYDIEMQDLFANI